MPEDLKQPECDCLSCQTEAVVSRDVSLANKGIMIIEEIEGLISQVNEKLESLDGGHYVTVKAKKKSQSLEDIDIFQKTTLCELRRAFE